LISENIFMQDLTVSPDEGHDARDRPCVDVPLHSRRDSRKTFHGKSVKWIMCSSVTTGVMTGTPDSVRLRPVLMGASKGQKRN